MFQKSVAGHPKFGAEREVRASPWGFAFGRSARSKKPFLLKIIQKVGAGWRQDFRWYERAGERPERARAAGLTEWCAGLQLAERASEFSAAGRELACLMNCIRNLSWPSQWRFQIPARIHPKFILTSQSVVIKKTHPKI